MNYIALIFGLMLSIGLMVWRQRRQPNCCIAILGSSWLGLAMIVFVSIRMIVEGSMEVAHKFL